MSGGGVSYLIIVAKLMQIWGYVYLVLLDFLDNSIDVIHFYFDGIGMQLKIFQCICWHSNWNHIIY
jgi:hypothetical protein